MALHHVLSLPGLHQVEIYTDSSSALKLVLNGEHNYIFVHEVANTCQSLKDAGCSLSLQWVPARSDVLGNSRADPLAATAHRDE